MVNKIYGMLGLAAKAGKIVSGTNVVLDNISKRKIFLILVAEDTSEKTIKNIEIICRKENVEFIIFGNIYDNSKVIGKQNRAIIGIKDKNFADTIKKLILGGE